MTVKHASVHSTIRVAASPPDVARALPERVQVEGFELVITGRPIARPTAESGVVHYETRWRDGERSGTGTIDLAPDGPDLTELSVRLDGMRGVLLGPSFVDAWRRRADELLSAIGGRVPPPSAVVRAV